MVAVVTEEIIARQPPEAQPILRPQLAEIVKGKTENAELRAQIA